MFVKGVKYTLVREYFYVEIEVRIHIIIGGTPHTWRRAVCFRGKVRKTKGCGNFE